MPLAVAASGWPDNNAAAVIAANRASSVIRPCDRIGHESTGELGVVDDDAATGRHHRQRVESLFTVADRQRDVHRGQVRRRSPRPPSSPRNGRSPDLPRHRPGPSDPGTAPRHRAVRPPPVCGRSRVFFGPCACRTETPAAASASAAEDTARLIDCAPSRTAEHAAAPWRRGRSRRKPWLRPARAARSSDGDRRAYGYSDHLDLSQSRFGYRREHAPRRYRTDPVGQSRAGVGLVDHHRMARRRPCSPKPPRAAR